MKLILSIFLLAIATGFAQRDAKTDSNLIVSAVNPGVVVEKVGRHTQAENSGVRPGDVLLTWKRDDVDGQIESPFDLLYIRFEQASRGLVSVRGMRGNKERIWHFGSDIWGISARPNLTGSLLTEHARAQDLLRKQNLLQAAELFRSMASESPNTVPWLAPWFLSRAAQVFFDASEWDASSHAYIQALSLQQSENPRVRAELLRQWGTSFEYRDDLINAERCYRQALLEWQREGPETMTVANSLLLIAVVELKEGDLERAEISLDSALQIAKRNGPSSLQAALALANLGVLYEDKGDLARAQKYYLLALKRDEKYFPGTTYVSHGLTSLGTLAQQEGNLARAEMLQRRALTIAERLDGDSFQVAAILTHLAECIIERGNFAAAEGYQKQALLIQRKLAPESIAAASMLASLGKIARKRHDLLKAGEYYAQAWELATRIHAPDREVASFLIGRAEVLRDQGQFTAAEQLYRQATSLLEKVAPESTDYGNTLADLAGTLRQTGHLQEAVSLYAQGLALLERKSSYLTDITEQRSRYRGRLAAYYAEYADVLRTQGNLQQAFEVIESARAHTLLEMLARVHIEPTADPGIREREGRVRAQLDAKSEYRLRLVTGNHTDQQVSEIDADISDLLLQYQEIEEQLRASDSAYAALLTPHRLRVPEIQNLLDQDTLLLEYVLGEESSCVWVLTNASIAAFQLPRRSAIEGAAQAVYRLLALRNSSLEHTPEFRDASVRLSQMVIGPISNLLKHKRLVIISDGALQYIPFSALPEPHTLHAVPLVLHHEIVNVPSASVLAELRQRQAGRKSATGTAAVIADPVFDFRDDRLSGTHSIHSSNQWSQSLTRSATDVGLSRDGKLYLNRLLYTRSEAQAVMSVIPREKGMLALDFEASRKTALSPVLANYRIVHFATHGIVDNKHPELSGLILSLVDRKGRPEDGFLKLQDIYNMKLPADLVVLSGCDTGVGQQIHGEGLISLTRGFMYAGATRVLASLWSVSDAATASFMADFYRGMEHERLSPAAALRAAQIQMRKQNQWSSPYYWAAFQLQGEWR